MCLCPIHTCVDGKHYFVPCGKCPECLRARVNDWSFRLQQEMNNCVNAYFITLTYEDIHLPFNLHDDFVVANGSHWFVTNHSEVVDPCGELHHATLNYEDIAVYIRSLRDKFKGDTIRYFFCGEYGPVTQRPHYHGILFYTGNRLKEFYTACQSNWKNGFTQYPSEVTPARLRYVAKYMSKGSDLDCSAWNIQKPRFVMSKNLGACYLKNKQYFSAYDFNLVSDNLGLTHPLPRYYYQRWFCEKVKKTDETTGKKTQYYKNKPYVSAIKERLAQLRCVGHYDNREDAIVLGEIKRKWERIIYNYEHQLEKEKEKAFKSALIYGTKSI